MTPPADNPSDPAQAVALEIAKRVLGDALATLRTLTPEGWDKAYYYAMDAGWHTTDMALLKDARLLSMRFAVRFKP